jgi:hypothetical protein
LSYFVLNFILGNIIVVAPAGLVILSKAKYLCSAQIQDATPLSRITFWRERLFAFALNNKGIKQVEQQKSTYLCSTLSLVATCSHNPAKVHDKNIYKKSFFTFICTVVFF